MPRKNPRTVRDKVDQRHGRDGAALHPVLRRKRPARKANDPLPSRRPRSRKRSEEVLCDLLDVFESPTGGQPEVVIVFALARDREGQWCMANHSVCQQSGFDEISKNGGLLGIPKAAAQMIRSKIVQEESVDRVKNAAMETGVRALEQLFEKLPNIIGRR